MDRTLSSITATTDGWNLPFGAGLELGRGIYIRPMYDGERSHLMAGYFGASWGVSLLAVWLEDPGISFTFGW